jgi:hypothetical protein
MFKANTADDAADQLTASILANVDDREQHEDLSDDKVAALLRDLENEDMSGGLVLLGPVDISDPTEDEVEGEEGGEDYGRAMAGP